MKETEYAILRLTQPHEVMTEAGLTSWPPLIRWLKDRVTDINRRGNGTQGPGLPLNSDALEVLNYIERQYRLLCEAAYIVPTRDLVEGVVRVWEVLKAERAGGRIEDDRWERIEDELTGWVQRIEGEQERPSKMELMVPCPRCETRWIIDDQERRVAAVVVEFSPGHAPVAECRVEECGAMWAGWAEVARLGFTVGAEQNQEILAACGIDTPTLFENTSM